MKKLAQIQASIKYTALLHYILNSLNRKMIGFWRLALLILYIAFWEQHGKIKRGGIGSYLFYLQRHPYSFSTSLLSESMWSLGCDIIVLCLLFLKCPLETCSVNTWKSYKIWREKDSLCVIVQN